MIAANDPQEFIPGGRQQAFRHPEPPEFELTGVSMEGGDDFLLHCLEKVKLNENVISEWWLLRKSTNVRKLDNSLTSKSRNSEQIPCSWRESVKSVISTTDSHSDMLVNDSWVPKVSDTNKKPDMTFTMHAQSYMKHQTSYDFENGPRSSLNSFATNEGTIKFCSPDEYIEEELYVRGNLVVWSQGLSYNDEDKARSIICCYSSYFPLKDVIWCTFQMESDDLVAEENPELNGEKLSCLCIADASNLRVYTKDGEDFVTTLPFQIKKMWPTKFGIIIERDDDDDSIKDSKSVVYSMNHPLDIAAPVAFCKGGCTKLMQLAAYKIVFTSESLDLCMIYDEESQQHIICRVRRVKSEELDAFNKTNVPGMAPSIMHTRNITVGHSMVESYQSMFFKGSPFSNHHPSIASGSYQLPSRGQSPMFAPGASNFHASSRCNTPVMSTPPGRKSNSPWIQRVSRLQSTVQSYDSCIMNRFPNMDTTVSNMVVLEPNYCLDQIWCEFLHDGSVNSPATNVFTTEDFMGRWYLCYLVPSRSQLSILKYEYSNNSDDIVFSKVVSVSAKDAVNIPHLHMLAVLEHTSNVILYSGLTIIGKLHIGGALAQHVPSPYAVKRSSKQFLNSPFPKRSSLLPSSSIMSSDPRFDEHLLSPVLPVSNTAVRQARNIMQMPQIGEVRVVLCGLKDSIDNRITLCYSDGSCYRVSLPNMAHSPLVEDCLNALRIALPRDLVMTTLSKWYAIRNLPGNVDMSHEDEWILFTKLIFELLGYTYKNNSSGEHRQLRNDERTPGSVKRSRQSSDGTISDWTFLQNHKKLSLKNIDEYLHLTIDRKRIVPNLNRDAPSFTRLGGSNLLFSHVRIIHYILHLVYEDLKLNTLRKNDLPLLAEFLAHLSTCLDLDKYVIHYWLDFPTKVSLIGDKSSVFDMLNVINWSFIPEKPTNILSFICGMVGRNGNETLNEISRYPVIDNLNTRSKNVIWLLATYLKYDGDVKGDHYFKVITPPGSHNNVKKLDVAAENIGSKIRLYTNDTNAQKTVLGLVDLKITMRKLETYPLAVNFILYDALWRCRFDPPTDWPPEAYILLHRPDLASQLDIIANAVRNESDDYDIVGECSARIPSRDSAINDGMEGVENEILKYRFSKDQRILEVRNLLQSSKPVQINLIQRPDVSDHDHLEEQEKQLYAICTRTMALPVGRGMFTLHTSTPIITEPLPAPPLCLTGKANPRGTTVELTHIDTPSNMAHWPQFHNGVANGLRVNPSAKHVDSTWIIFNKPKSSSETLMEHAGFLMALGLNGHLKNLAVLNRFDYLSKFHEMTSVGILLGLGAAFRGTSNQAVTKMLSVHVEGLLPPTSIELDVPQNLQVASLLGVGLIYQGTAQRRMIEVMLTEIGRPPGPEMENSVDRQSYSLAAGLALGLITLRQGGSTVGLSDLKVPDTLHYYMVGGNKRPLGGTQKEKYKVPSFQIREGSTVNLDVTASGATLALGLMYLGTGNKAIAGWMAPPDTHYLLDFVRPDFLMLRTLCRALILWNDIQPAKDWIETQVPESIRQYCMVEPNPHCDLDYEAMNQAYCNIIAGACFALGLKYAGTADESVYDLLLEYCHMFTSLQPKTIAELAGKPTLETCVNVVLISVAMVMAGTGDLDTIRVVRYLRQRVGLASSAVVTYGSHMALHMALGLLFLGGGRYTLSNSPSSVAALICAFYPKFPTHSNDNRYHLQAFRHLYVLASEPRLIMPRDITTGKMCYANLEVVKLDGGIIDVKAPALIPDLSTLYKVSVYDIRYWPVVFKRERNWEQLLKLLEVSGQVDVKQRAGCLSYNEDKTGFRSELARTLTNSTVIPWDPPAKSIVSFSSDTIVRLFADQFLMIDTTTMTLSAECSANQSRISVEANEVDESDAENDNEETKLRHAFTRTAYECVIKDKLAALPLRIQLIQIVNKLPTTATASDIWHLKIVESFVRNDSVLVNNEQLLTLHEKALSTIDNWEPQLWDALRAFVSPRHVNLHCDLDRLAKYITFYSIPYRFETNGTNEILELIYRLQGDNFESESIDKILRILGHVR